MVRESYVLFDRIAARYDLLNRLLSFGMDIRWRRQVSSMIREVPHERVLDIACGTGDLILAALSRLDDIECGVGVDMAGKMLEIGKRKIANRKHDGKASLVKGDGLQLPVTDEAFDVAMIAFGIRNMADPGRALTEMYRILKPGGRLAVLEFSIPRNPLFRSVYLIYFRHILPLIGRAVSGDPYAYRYLNRTVESFFPRDVFRRIVEDAGFTNLRVKPLSFGIATIYCGDKP